MFCYSALRGKGDLARLAHHPEHFLKLCAGGSCVSSAVPRCSVAMGALGRTALGRGG
ncbi:hypothetical protein DM02DRAFT_620669 [Periconia macrospinosa]|uniref:Uncharacterized protein n=1 Tax=Periconia macrospinosa TaxID=97972 RepID=A0A2V1CZD6_9PLEO|nr:hypothetical protein DM02DRAFT_620669 [Periconia macrospinosa]